MTPEESRAYLELQAMAAVDHDNRLDKIADREWVGVDRTINGTMRGFLGEVELLRRLPFPQSEPGNNEPNS